MQIRELLISQKLPNHLRSLENGLTMSRGDDVGISE